MLEAGRVAETYDIGGLCEMTNIDVVKTVCGILDELRPDSRFAPHDKLITYIKDRPGHDRRYAIDASKITRELGWRPAESFHTGIRKTVKWYLDNLAWAEDVVSGAYKKWIALNYGTR